MAFDRTECQHEVLSNLLVGGTMFQQEEHLQQTDPPKKDSTKKKVA